MLYGTFTYIFTYKTGHLFWANVGIHIPAPWFAYGYTGMSQHWVIPFPLPNSMLPTSETKCGRVFDLDPSMKHREAAKPWTIPVGGNKIHRLWDAHPNMAVISKIYWKLYAIPIVIIRIGNNPVAPSRLIWCYGAKWLKPFLGRLKRNLVRPLESQWPWPQL